MRMLMGDPTMQMRIYGTDPDEAHYVDALSDEYEYDEFIGKWLKKRKAKRAEKRAKKYSVTKPVKTQVKRATAPIRREPVKGSLANPITNKDLKGHKVINNAIQNELKTLQEEQKAEGLKKKVEQEELKKENLKQQAGLMGAGKGLLVVVGVLGTIGLLAYLHKSAFMESSHPSSVIGAPVA